MSKAKPNFAPKIYIYLVLYEYQFRAKQNIICCFVCSKLPLAPYSFSFNHNYIKILKSITNKKLVFENLFLLTEDWFILAMIKSLKMESTLQKQASEKAEVKEWQMLERFMFAEYVAMPLRLLWVAPEYLSAVDNLWNL